MMITVYICKIYIENEQKKVCDKVKKYNTIMHYVWYCVKTIKFNFGKKKIFHLLREV